MVASSIFMGSFAILLFFNAAYVMGGGIGMGLMVTGTVLGLLATMIPVVVVASFQAFGSGLNTASVKIMFGMSCLMSVLWCVDLPVNFSDFTRLSGSNEIIVAGLTSQNAGSFRIGLGMANNVISCFPIAEFGGIGFVFATCLSLLCMVSGIIIIIGGGD